MTDVELQSLLDKHELASEDWELNHARHMQHDVYTTDEDGESHVVINCWHRADAEFVVAAHDAVPELVRLVRDLRDAHALACDALQALALDNMAKDAEIAELTKRLEKLTPVFEAAQKLAPRLRRYHETMMSKTGFFNIPIDKDYLALVAAVDAAEEKS